MNRNASILERALARILPGVEKPGRYTGGELNQVRKEWDSVAVRLALVFPDLYDLGMSNLGLTALYEIVNARPEYLAERAFLPWVDMNATMRGAGIPLFSLENHRPLREFDVVGISLPYESLYTNALEALDLAGIPVRAAERTDAHPLVIGGGHAAFNPEPMADFFDAFVVGEGEEALVEVLDAVRASRASGETRPRLLERLAGLWGVYIPSFYQPAYRTDGTLERMDRLNEAAHTQVVKRIVAPLPPPPVRPIVPYIETVHNRYAIEIMRGCTRGCRFCQAGAATRPVRERAPEAVIHAIDQALAATGYEEVALLSLSSSDYSRITELVRALGSRHASSRLRISLPSLRIATVSLDLMEALRGNRGGGGNFTLAPEAATERLRAVINKPLQAAQLLETVREIYRRKWTTVKLYFMIGHPQETLDDVRAIADLCKAVLAEGRRALGRRAEVHAGVSTFIPKPHTPFQWAAMDAPESIAEKQALLRRELRGPGLKLDYPSPEETLLEARLSRGDRRCGEAVYRAWRAGARFDAWSEHFRPDAWAQGFSDAGLDPSIYSHRERAADEIFPWDTISTGVRKAFLRREYERSLKGETLEDCREECFACGILPAFRELRQALPDEALFCATAGPR